MKNDENHPTTIQHVGLLEGKRESGTGQLVGIYHFRSKRYKNHVSRSVEETEQTLSPEHVGLGVEALHKSRAHILIYQSVCSHEEQIVVM